MQWQRICGVHSQESQRVLNSVVAAYREPTRRYHGLAHVLGVVSRINELALQPLWSDPQDAADDVNAAVMAAWFHDVVYDAQKSDNEAASAERASADLLGLGLPLAFVAKVADLVRMTIEHRPTDPAGALLADADLWTLGGDEVDYFTYGDLIRLEYAHVPEQAWRSGRAAFIQLFLSRDHIFNTPRGQVEREAQARRNLLAEFEMLTT